MTLRHPSTPSAGQALRQGKLLRRFWPKTLKAQLLFYGTLSVLITGAVVGWLDFRTADADARGGVQEHMLEVSTALVSALERVGPQQGQQILDAFQRGYGAEEDSDTEDIDLQGRIIAASRRTSIGKSVEEATGHPEPEVTQVLAGQLPQAQTQMTHHGVPIFDLTLPLHGDPTDPARVTGALHYAEPYTAYTELLQQTLLRYLLSELLLVVLLLVPFWLFLERRILRPVQRIVEANRALASGRREVAFSESDLPENEIGEIARSRAEMLARLETVRAQERLAKLNECLLSFGADPDENINRLVTFCGEQLQATCALYNRLEDRQLRALGQWHTPPDFVPVDKPDGHICYDVIQSPRDDVHVIRDLPHTAYAQTDPNVIRYALRTYVGKAVALEGAFVGSLCVVYQEDTSPSEDDLNLLGISASAVGVEEKRKRAEEERERLLREAETLREIASVVAGTLQQDQAIERILQQLARVVPFDSASVQLLGDGYLEIVGGRGWPDPTAVVGLRFPMPGDNPNTRVIQERRPHIENRAREAYAAFQEEPHSHIRSWLGVPLIVGEQVIGMLALDRVQEDYFTQDHARLVSAFANQVAIAIENARLYTKTEQMLQTEQHRREAAVALLEITQVAGSSLELKQVLKQIAQRTAAACQANRCTIFLLDEPGEYLQPIMSQFANGHADLEQWQAFKAATADRVDIVPLFQQAIRERRPALLEDAARIDLVPLKWTQPFGIQKLLAVPLVSRDRAIGLMALDHTEASRAFTLEQIDLVLTIGGQVAANIENARLYTELQTYARQQAALFNLSAALAATLDETNVCQ